MHSPQETPVGRAGRACRALTGRWFLLAMIVMQGAALALSTEAESQSGMLGRFHEYRLVIRAGFDLTVIPTGPPTFPIWGYGWLFAATEDAAVWLVVQAALAVWATWLFVRTVERSALLGAPALRAFKLLVLVSIPWYTFHAHIWPASVATSLVVASLALLGDVLREPRARWWRVASAGVLFGLSVNFRPEVLLLPLPVALVLAVAKRMRWRAMGEALVWLGCTYASLIPWAVYTKMATGRVLLTATHGGLTSLTGFGHVPNNRWGITLDDHDPTVAGWVEEHFGEPRCVTRPEVDAFLKRKFVEIVRADPGEYARKCKVTFIRHVWRGVYPGEVHMLFVRLLEQPESYYVEIRGLLARDPLEFFRLTGPAGVLCGLHLYAALLGRIVVFLSFLLLVVLVPYALVRRQAFLLVLQGAILYTALVVTLLANGDGRFSSPVYLFHLVNLVVGVELLAGVLRRRPRSR